MTRPVQLFADGDIIGAVQHHMVRPDQSGKLIIIQLFGNGFSPAMRIDGFQRNRGGFCFAIPIRASVCRI